MSLRSLDLPLLLNTSDRDLIQKFFAPALEHSFRYDRGVGYFSSGWLRLAALRMVDVLLHNIDRFAANEALVNTKRAALKHYCMLTVRQKCRWFILPPTKKEKKTYNNSVPDAKRNSYEGIWLIH